MFFVSVNIHFISSNFFLNDHSFS